MVFCRQKVRFCLQKEWNNKYKTKWRSQLRKREREGIIIRKKKRSVTCREDMRNQASIQRLWNISSVLTNISLSWDQITCYYLHWTSYFSQMSWWKHGNMSRLFFKMNLAKLFKSIRPVNINRINLYFTVMLIHLSELCLNFYLKYF